MDHHDKRESDSGAHSVDDIKAAISKLSKSDRVGTASRLLTLVGGAAGGASAAGAVAGAAGATTLLGSSSLAGLLGGVFVVSTPVGWIAGCALAGGAAAYGVSRLIKSGGMNDQIRTDMVGRLTTRLEGLLNRSEAVVTPAAETFREYIELAVADKTLSAEQAHRVVTLVASGKLDPALAIERIKKLKANA